MWRGRSDIGGFTSGWCKRGAQNGGSQRQPIILNLSKEKGEDFTLALVGYAAKHFCPAVAISLHTPSISF